MTYCIIDQQQFFHHSLVCVLEEAKRKRRKHIEIKFILLYIRRQKLIEISRQKISLRKN